MKWVFPYKKEVEQSRVDRTDHNAHTNNILYLTAVYIFVYSIYKLISLKD